MFTRHLRAVDMAISGDEHRLLYRIAQAHYEDGLTQQQIAERFGVSRPKVSRLLQRAKRERVVTITLVPPAGCFPDLERGLEQRYGLDEAIVVSVTDPSDLTAVKRELGPAAADWLVRSIHGDEVVALAWGLSILSMAEALPTRRFPGVTVVQLLGGLGPVDDLEHSAELTRRVAQRLGARLRLLPAPGIVSSREAAQALRADRRIAETLALAARADIAVVGIGILSPDTVLLREGVIVTQRDLDVLRQAGVVGDVILRYLDANGTPLDLEINERIVGLTLQQLRQVPRVMGIAGGEAKHAVVRAALRGGLLDVLVTDHVTAQSLLDEAG